MIPVKGLILTYIKTCHKPILNIKKKMEGRSLTEN